MRKIAHHQKFDNEDVIQMMFITPRGDRKCLVFLRENEDERKCKQVKYRQRSIK